MFEYVWMVEYVCLPEHSLTYMFMIVCYMWWGMLMNHQCSVLNRFQPQIDGGFSVPKPCLKCPKRWFDFKRLFINFIITPIFGDLMIQFDLAHIISKKWFGAKKHQLYASLCPIFPWVAKNGVFVGALLLLRCAHLA